MLDVAPLPPPRPSAPSKLDASQVENRATAATLVFAMDASASENARTAGAAVVEVPPGATAPSLALAPADAARPLVFEGAWTCEWRERESPG